MIYVLMLILFYHRATNDPTYSPVRHSSLLSYLANNNHSRTSHSYTRLYRFNCSNLPTNYVSTSSNPPSETTAYLNSFLFPLSLSPHHSFLYSPPSLRTNFIPHPPLLSPLPLPLPTPPPPQGSTSM